MLNVFLTYIHFIDILGGRNASSMIFITTCCNRTGLVIYKKVENPNHNNVSNILIGPPVRYTDSKFCE